MCEIESSAVDLGKSVSYFLSTGEIPHIWKRFRTDQWEFFAEFTYKNGISALMFHQLRKLNSQSQSDLIDFIPEETVTSWKKSYYETTSLNLIILKELDHLAKALEKEKITFIVLKGPALILSLYESISLRPMSDIDLLVKPGDLRKAISVISEEGYKIQKATYHINFRGGPGDRLEVELHWSLMSINESDLEWFFRNTNRLRSSTLSNSNASFYNPLTLNPTSNILYLAAHLIYQHDPKIRLIWLYDIYLLLQKNWKDNIVWDELISEANRIGWNDALEKALKNVNELFGSIPELCPTLEGVGINRTEVLKSSASNTTESTLLKRWIATSFSVVDLRLRLYLLRYFFFPSRRYVLSQYSNQSAILLPIFYVDRLFRILLFGNTQNRA